MNRNRKELISDLSRDLASSSRAGRTTDLITLWLIFNFVAALLLVTSTGSFREGSFQQAYEHPRFLLESLTGLLAIVLLGVTAIRSGIPSNTPALKQYSPALLILIIWLGFYVAGIWFPALEPSTLGKRDFPCFLETMLYGLPSLVMGLYLIGRLWPLDRMWAGLMTGLAAGATPALIMQFACMYIPTHIITHHLIPGLTLGIVGIVGGKLFLKKA